MKLAVVGVLSLVLLAVGGWLLVRGSATSSPSGPSGPSNSSSSDSGTALAPGRATSNLPTMAVRDLPPEGVDTLKLIAKGGPYPYAKDSTTFGNRERILPRKASGFYTEYTVPTPGEGDRGARRIVAGDDGSRFYTADHYETFREVVSR